MANQQSGKMSAPQQPPAQAHHVMPPANRAADQTQKPKRGLLPAGDCPMSENHKNTFVYSTRGRTRHCKCNDCGHTWKVTGPFAEGWREFVMSLAERLAQSPRQEIAGGEKVVVLRTAEVDAICQQLTGFAEAG